MREVLRLKKEDNIFNSVLSFLVTIRTNSQIIHHYHD